MVDLIYPEGDRVPVVKGGVMSGPSEMLPVVDSVGMVRYQASRSYCHCGSKLLHPVVHLHVINRRGQLYLQQRGMHKDLLPGFWDTAVGGHVSFGETILEALFRESSEELGLSDFNPHWLCSYVFESQTEKELVNVFAAVGEFRMVPDSEELEGGRFWSMDEIDEAVGKSVLTPNFEGEFQKIKEQLIALL